MFNSLLKISSFYKDFLKGYYLSNPRITEQNFEGQYKHLMDQGYGYSNYFPRYLEKDHAVRSFEIIHNADPLQRAWAGENDCGFTGDELLLEQIERYQPEVLYFQDSTGFHAGFFDRVKERVTSVRILVGHICSPYTAHQLEAFRRFDIMLTCSEKFRIELASLGMNCYLFPHAFEASLVPEIETGSAPVNDISFIGSLLYRSEYHQDRIAYVEEIIRNRLPLTMYGMIEEDTWHVLKAKQIAYLGMKGAEKLGIKRLFTGRSFRKIALLNEMPVKARYSREIKQNLHRDLIFGKDMLREISQHAVSFNMHAEVAGEYAANVRMFEATGAGSLLVTDHKKNMHELFRSGEEILTYRNREECVEKLRWALDHPDMAAEIAARGQKRTLKDHSVEKRVELLVEILEKEYEKAG